MEAALAPPITAAPAVAPLTPVDLARGLAGYLLLPAVGVVALGVRTGDPAALAHPILLGAAVPTGALLLSVPGLLVGHQVLNLRSAPTAPLAAVGRAFLRVGEVALGLCPALVLFTLTTGSAPALMLAALAGLGLSFLLLSTRALDREEARASAELGPRLKMAFLARAWAGLVLLVGLRLYWDLAALLSTR